MRRLTLLFTIAGLLLFGCAAPQPKSSPTAAEPTENASFSAVDSVLSSARQRHDLPAMAAAVVRSRAVLETEVTGIRRMGRPARIQESDQFHIGSNTKAMTATLLAELVQEGALEWSAAVEDAFPAFSDSTAAAYRTVTLEELLSHRAGAPPFTDGAEYEKLPSFEGSPKEQREAFAKWLLRREPEHKPGTRFLYSNAGYAIACAMAEKITGASWEEMMRRRLFRPLGIAGSVSGWPAAADSAQPWGHWTEKSDTLQPHSPNGSYHIGTEIAPAGDVSMSIGDYAEFIQLHLRGLQGEETKLLAPPAFRYMHAPQIGMGASTGDSTEAGGYALGWGVQQIRGARTSTHAGSGGTFFALAAIQPSRDLAVAVFTNAGSKEAEAASSEVLVALLERYSGAQQ